ncbi:ankyrin [Periconia macrospinosa]|uniref:Ankyrin n=1 Tax=Periconia macrospinosa TaxID=97972 RepID=A0A2V1DBG9_9PLEO|nr:ankyrin [Periconia macrospinosa]PVH95432.1 ankyrin [Periconia macrospinosa]
MRAELELSTSAINQKDSKGRTPLAWASARGDEQSVRTLLEFGADPNISCATGNSPLLRSVRARSPECIGLLLQHGANVRSKIRDKDGWTALLRAANSNSHSVLKLLLEHNADHRAITFRNETILHFVASKGDNKTLAILSEFALKDLDINAKDHKDQTAADVMALRSPQPSQIAASFRSLLESLIH